MSRHEGRDYDFGLGDDGVPGLSTTTTAGEGGWQDVLKTTLPLLANIYQQDKLAKMNIARMNQGLQPITGADYARLYQMPTAQVQVGPSEEAQKLMLYGVIALGGFLLLRAKKVI